MTSGANKRWWNRTEQVGRAVETWLIVLILAGLVVLGATQIVLRNVFSTGLSWADGLSRLAVLWLGLLGAVAASRDGRHITLGALTRWLPERARRFTGVVADLAAGCVSATLAWHAWVFVADSREFGDTLLNDIPAWWFQAVMPVAFALMAIQFVVRAVRGLLGRATPVEIAP